MEISKKMPLSRTLVSWCNFLPFLFSKKDYDHAVPVLLSVFDMLPFFKLCHVYLSFEATVKVSSEKISSKKIHLKRTFID